VQGDLQTLNVKMISVESRLAAIEAALSAIQNQLA
jgi:hypothetical protein